jgi:predicted dehydrogenase
MNEMKPTDFNRRDFLKGGSLATMMTLLGGVELTMQPRAAKGVDADKLHGPPVKCGVIGLGAWGREIVGTLALLPEAQVAAVCDKYPASLRRIASAAPNAKPIDDYRRVLDDKEIQAVIVATPTPQHREIVLAALEAGKHVYCEAPLAHTVEDARAIALAAKGAIKQVFQSGLQTRSDPQRHFLLQFIRSGATGRPLMARAQWHKKQSWRQPSPNPDREKELNWRLRQETTTGLVGEIGIHQLDAASWFLNAHPTAATGFGALQLWEDGRNVPDTIQTVFEYPQGVRLMFDCTLANSFDSSYEVYFGSDAAIMVRDAKAWMFKEVDSPLLGWEVYAKKDTFYEETGIALVANATKLSPAAEKPGEESPYASTPLHYALEAFVSNVNEVSAAAEDFSATFNPNDKAALAKYITDVKKQPAAGYKEGFEATVAVIKANEAVVTGEKVKFQKEWFDLG